MFKIADLEFEIENAVLDGFISEEDGGIGWGIEIQAKERDVEDGRWRPKASAEILMYTGHGELENWGDLSGRQISWNEPLDTDGEPRALLCVFEHQPIYESCVRIEVGPKGALALDWAAKSDVLWKAPYTRGLDLRVQTELEFVGIWCGKMPEEACTKALSMYLTDADFAFRTVRAGTSLMVPNT